MANGFSRTMAGLRQELGCSQRRVAADLGISQALLSHYENGAREPGLDFIVRACAYYGVSADYLLGRTEIRRGCAERIDDIRRFADELRSMAGEVDEFAGGRTDD